MRDLVADGFDLIADAGTAAALLPLEIRGLTYAVQDRVLIDRLDLTLRRSGITVVVGANGAGKSLLLRLIHGLVGPDAGQVLWNGEPLSPSVARRQAMVFQKPVLLRRSVAANVDFVLRARGRRNPARRDALLHSVGLGDRGAQPARLLSGGEQQRLAIARALASDPEVLFLDEPTASLDPASVQAIETIVARVSAQGTKVVFVTHDMGQARRLADDVVFVEAGRVAEHALAGDFFDAPASAAAKAYLAGRLHF